MPRRENKGKQKKVNFKRTSFTYSDITLKDFADSPIASSRPKKIAQSSTVSSLEASQVLATTDLQKDLEDLQWFEKDFDDFTFSPERDSRIDDEEEDDTGVQEDVQQYIKRSIKKSKNNFNTSEKSVIYPFDLWHLLSDYIEPEDISRFSRICRDAYLTTQKSAFWRRLYKKYYKQSSSLPDNLKPHRLEKLHGLRARVIRSLFHSYALFADRISSIGPFDDEPHRLTGYRCLLTWHQPATKGWQFSFKLQRPSLKAFNSSQLSQKINIKSGYDDPFYNPEEGCCILQVTSCHFASIDTSVMGLLISGVYVTLSPGFRHHRLKLHFDTRLSASHSSSPDTVVVLNDVLTLKIIEWWYPSYPFTS